MGEGKGSRRLAFWLEKLGGDGVQDTLPLNRAPSAMEYFRLKDVGETAEAGESG